MPILGFFFVYFLVWYFRDAPSKDQLQIDTREWLDIPVFIIAGRLIILRSQLIAMGIYTLLFAAIVWPRWLEPAIRTQFQRPAVSSSEILATRTTPLNAPPPVAPRYRVEVIDPPRPVPTQPKPKVTPIVQPETSTPKRAPPTMTEPPGQPKPVYIGKYSQAWLKKHPHARERIRIKEEKEQATGIIPLPAAKELPVIELPAVAEEPENAGVKKPRRRKYQRPG